MPFKERLARFLFDPPVLEVECDWCGYYIPHGGEHIVQRKRVLPMVWVFCNKHCAVNWLNERLAGEVAKVEHIDGDPVIRFEESGV